VKESKSIQCVKPDSLGKEKGFAGFWLGTFSFLEQVMIGLGS
jgi:hypothetical protein